MQLHLYTSSNTNTASLIILLLFMDQATCCLYQPKHSLYIVQISWW